MKPLIFITFCSDSRYFYLLFPFIQSIRQNYPKTEIRICHYSISNYAQELLVSLFDYLVFEKFDLPKNRDAEYINSMRLQHYVSVVKQLEVGTRVCLIDCDTLVIKPIDIAYESVLDCAFTYKQSKFPLNYGVIFGRSGSGLVAVLQYIVESIEQTFQSRQSVEFANRYSGAADQHAIHELIVGKDNLKLPNNFSVTERTNIFEKRYYYIINSTSASISFLSCEQYNQTECTAITNDLRIIHYKAGWHKVLQKMMRPEFSEYRPENQCSEMFIFWQKTVRSAYHRLQEYQISTIRQNCSGFYDRISLFEYKKGGILPSEMLAVITLIQKHGIKRIVESGRYNGFSTEILSSLLPDTQIDSFDRLPNLISKNTEVRLRNRKNIKFYYGDSSRMIPYHVKHIREPFAVLIDGPKGEAAVKLALHILNFNPFVQFIFIHDTPRGYASRHLLEEDIPHAWYTDQEHYVRDFAKLDRQSGFDQYADFSKYHFNENIVTGSNLSYGPTLAVICNIYSNTQQMSFYQKILVVVLALVSQLWDHVYVKPKYHLSRLLARDK